MERKALLKCLLTFTAQYVYVLLPSCRWSSRAALEIPHFLDLTCYGREAVHLPIIVQQFAIAQHNLCPRITLEFHPYPAGEILPELEKESEASQTGSEAFSEARSELASILPDIAEGFSTQAKAEEDIGQAEELVGLAEEAMELVNAPKYIPTSLRVPIQATINGILEDIELAKRNINRTKRLDEAVKAIRDAAKEGNTVKAYDERRVLLNEYPELERAPPLVEVVLLITERERDLVKVDDSPAEPSTEDHSRAQDLQVTLASRSGKGALETNPPRTPVSTLERSRKIALDAGVHYVYAGNVHGHEGENTYCHNCHKLLIKRWGFRVSSNNITGGLIGSYSVMNDKKTDQKTSTTGVDLWVEFKF